MTTTRRPRRRPAAACRSKSGPASCATAHQGVPVAGLPKSQAGGGGLLSNLFQSASQVSDAATAIVSAIRASSRSARTDPVRRRLSPATDTHLRTATESIGPPGSSVGPRWLVDGPGVRREPLDAARAGSIQKPRKQPHARKEVLDVCSVRIAKVGRAALVHRVRESFSPRQCRTMQIVAVGVEPGLGALDMAADFATTRQNRASGSSRPDARLHGRRDSPAHRAARGSAARKTTMIPPTCRSPSGSIDRGSTPA